MINLTKGQGINLSKQAPGLAEVQVGLGWDTGPGSPGSGGEDGSEFDFDLEFSEPAAEGGGSEFDLDVSLFMLGAGNKLPADEFFLFYNNLRSPDGAVVHQGDNRTGAGEGDDETILISLPRVDPAVRRILILATIHEAQARGQSFAQVRNAYIRLVNNATGEEVLRYALDEDFSDETAVVFGELLRDGPGWAFNALGKGSRDDLEAFVGRYA